MNVSCSSRSRAASLPCYVVEDAACMSAVSTASPHRSVAMPATLPQGWRARGSASHACCRALCPTSAPLARQSTSTQLKSQNRHSLAASHDWLLLTPFTPAHSASWPAHRTQRRHQLARPGGPGQSRQTQSLTCRCPAAGRAQPAQSPSPALLPTASMMPVALRTAKPMAQHTTLQSRPLSRQAPLARTLPFPSRRVLTTDCLPAEPPASL